MAGALLGIAEGITNAGLGLALNEHNRQQNFYANEEAAKAADKRTRALYNDLYSPGAILEQYQEAGLSPSLMYGNNAGGGGTSGAQGSGSAGPGAIFTPFNIAGAQAQIQLAQSQARKNNVEADVLEGNNERGQAELGKILSEAGLNKAVSKLNELQAIGQKIANEIAENTKEFNIKTVEYNMQYMEQLSNRAVWEALDSKLTYEFNVDTYEDRVNTIAENYANLAMDTLLKEAQKNYNEESVNWLIEQEAAIKQYVINSIIEVNQRWRALDLQEKDINTRKAIADKQIQSFYRELDQRWMMFTKQLAQDKYFGEKGITQKYWEMGVNAVNNVIRTAGNIVGLYNLGRKGKVGTVTNTNPSPKPGDNYGQGEYFW